MNLYRIDIVRQLSGLKSKNYVYYNWNSQDIIWYFSTRGFPVLPVSAVVDLSCSPHQSFFHHTFAVHCRHRRWNGASHPRTLSIRRSGENPRVPCRVTRRASQKTYQTIDHANNRILLYAATPSNRFGLVAYASGAVPTTNPSSKWFDVVEMSPVRTITVAYQERHRPPRSEDNLIRPGRNRGVF